MFLPENGDSRSCKDASEEEESSWHHINCGCVRCAVHRTVNKRHQSFAHTKQGIHLSCNRTKIAKLRMNFKLSNGYATNIASNYWSKRNSGKVHICTVFDSGYKLMWILTKFFSRYKLRRNASHCNKGGSIQNFHDCTWRCGKKYSFACKRIFLRILAFLITTLWSFTVGFLQNVQIITIIVVFCKLPPKKNIEPWIAENRKNRRRVIKIFFYARNQSIRRRLLFFLDRFRLANSESRLYRR